MANLVKPNSILTLFNFGKYTQKLSLYRIASVTVYPSSTSNMQKRYRATSATVSVDKNLQLFSPHEKEITLSTGTDKLKVVLKSSQERPLTVMLCWLMAKPRHVMKLADLYLHQGFDVLTVRITPWQLLWPMKGTQLVAENILEFLRQNEQYRTMFIHGFSVGGYLWGEALVRIAREPEKYKPLLQRIVGQVWDSAADIDSIPNGVPHAMFPNNDMLQKSVETCIRYHMKTFYNTATIHYINSSESFHNNLLRCPALMFFSRSDPVGKADKNFEVLRSWESLGVKTYVKCWEKSNHVSHFYRYTDEYLAELYAFMEKVGLRKAEGEVAEKLRKAHL